MLLCFTFGIATTFAIGLCAQLSGFRKKQCQIYNLYYGFNPPYFQCRRCLKGTKPVCNLEKNCGYILFNKLTKIIKSASVSIDICCALLTNEIIVNLLIDAHRQGIVVQIIQDDNLCSSGKDGKNVSQELAHAGILLKKCLQSGTMHNKYIIIDRKILWIGSMSLTRGGFFGNYENLEITDDPFAVKAFCEEFKNIWSNL